MPKRVGRAGGGLKGRKVVGKTARLSGLHGLSLGRYSTGFEPAILSVSMWGNVWLLEAATAGSSQDATVSPPAAGEAIASATTGQDGAITKDAAGEAAISVSRAAGYVYQGSTTAYESEAVTAIQKLAFSTMSSSTLGAVASLAKAFASGACSLANGYAAGGIDTASTVIATVQKFSMSAETGAANSASLSRIRYWASGFANDSYVHIAGGIVGPAGDQDTYVARINNATDAITETSVSSADNHRNSPAAVCGGDKGYICGGYTGAAQSNTITRITPATMLASTMSATLTSARQFLGGASSKTKGYIVGSVDTADIFTFATETRATGGTAYPATNYSGMAGMVGNGKAHFGGGHDGSSAVSLIVSAAFATDTMATESATLATAINAGVGFDPQQTSSGGSDSVQDGIPGTPPNTVLESTGAACGLFGGGYDSSISSRTKRIAQLTFQTETFSNLLESSCNTTYQNNRWQSLKSTTKAYFCGGYNSDPAKMSDIGYVNFSTHASGGVAGSLIGTPVDGIGLDYTTFGIVCGYSPSQTAMDKLLYSTEARSTVTVSAFTGTEYTGFSTATKGYILGGESAGTRVCSVTFADMTSATLSVTLPAARWRPASIDLDGSAFVGGGQNSGNTANYASVAGFLASTEASRTTSATLGTARGGLSGVSGYAKGYFGTGYTYNFSWSAQYLDAVSFSTEAATVTGATTTLFGGVGVSYRPATGAGAIDTVSNSWATSAAIDGQATSDASQNGSLTVTRDIAESATANHAFDSVLLAVASRSEPATADDSRSVILLAVASTDESASASAVVFTLGIDVGIGESATSTSSESASAAFAAECSGAITATANQTVLAVFAPAITAAATATDNPIAGNITSADGSAIATADTTPVGQPIMGASASGEASATDSSERGFILGGSFDAPASATAEQYGSTVMVSLAAASATSTQSVTASVQAVSITSVGAAGSSQRAFAVMTSGATAEATAVSYEQGNSSLHIGRGESASAGDQSAVTASFSAVTLAQLDALDQAFASGVLNASAAEALLAIVASYVVLVGEDTTPYRMYVVSKVEQRYVVSIANSERTIRQVGTVFAVRKEEERITVSDVSGVMQLVVKVPSDD